MVSRADVLSRVRPFQNYSQTLVDLQDTNDIISGMMECHAFERKEYDNICELFDAGSAYEIGQNLWDFLKENVKYTIEKEGYQTVRSPAAIVATGNTWGADCKNYSLFSGGVIDALNRKGAGIPWAYRYASYKLFSTTPEHVFVVLYPGAESEIWIDPVLSSYDYHKQPSFYKDRKMLAKVSGIPNSRHLSAWTGRAVVGGVMGQGDGDIDDDPGFNVQSETPDIDPNAGATTDSGGTDSIDIDALPSTQVSNGPDLPADAIQDPAQSATANISDTVQNVSETESSPSIFSQALAALTGGSSSGGSAGSGASSALTPKSSSNSNPTTTTASTPVYASGSNLPMILGIAAVAVVAIILIKKK
jgi:hypothetical protein